ncbi:hypothetical protein IWQ60_006112 [Tieghemiomyces parasiticus]|uniref:Ribosomal protein n=1 Tax=Tieghemiomyces parasiticus TaxID=78921 RepID=A0A9W8AB24_9FUNG|nr:hypothetical protein IWQ60_006112 [Tieghemiomyces parasiticus]
MSSPFRLLRALPAVRWPGITPTPVSYVPNRAYRLVNRNRTTSKSEISSAITLEQAMPIIQAYAAGRPNYTMTLSIKCRKDRRTAPVRGTCVLPNSVTKDPRILVFAEGEHANVAIEAGAAIVGGAELLPQIIEEKLKFDKVLSTLEMLPTVAKIARFLGPKGLMPTRNKGTATDDLVAAMQLSRSALDYRMDQNYMVHCVIGKAGFTIDQIRENISTLLNEVRAHAPKKALVAIQGMDLRQANSGYD